MLVTKKVLDSVKSSTWKFFKLWMSGAEVDCIFTVFAKYSMINLLSNLINRNCSAAKISKVKSSSDYWLLAIIARNNLIQNVWIPVFWNMLKTVLADENKMICTCARQSGFVESEREICLQVLSFPVSGCFRPSPIWVQCAGQMVQPGSVSGQGQL